MSAAAEIGVIGGSGIYDMPGLTQLEEVALDTPFGSPSDRFRIGVLGGRRVAFLARHGRGHRLLPGEINYRANLFALKQLGVTRILSASAVGSLREDIHPLDIVLPDQFFDRTRGRAATFFGGGIAAHVAFGDPVCPELLERLASAGPVTGRTIHRGGTYVCMEGPQFSTRAESEHYRGMGGSVIGMTNLTEAKLAREAEMCYATMALVTDYDCWHEAESVSVEVVIGRLHQNAEAAQTLVRIAIESLPVHPACHCGQALENAILTRPEHVPDEVREKLSVIVGRHLPGRNT